MTSPFALQIRDAFVAITPEQPGAVDALSRLYDAAVLFRDPIQTLRGRESFLAMNRRLLGRMRRLEWDVHTTLGDDREVFLEWTMRAWPKLAPALVVDGVTRIRHEGGLVVDHRDYWDVGEMFASALPGGQKLLHLVRTPLA
jgi:limonene-1,2-epoxide hydrolase